MLMPQIDKATGYPKVMLSNGKSPRPRSVHSIVAEAFLGSRPAGLQVAHKDGDRTNFTASNLRYDSQAGNEADKIAHGTRLRGEAVGNSKLTSESVKAIKESKLPQREIAAAFGISQGHVSEIKSGKKWRHTEAGA
jgi:predicted XRE-type DNA-binding protein